MKASALNPHRGPCHALVIDARHHRFKIGLSAQLLQGAAREIRTS